MLRDSMDAVVPTCKINSRPRIPFAATPTLPRGGTAGCSKVRATWTQTGKWRSANLRTNCAWTILCTHWTCTKVMGPKLIWPESDLTVRRSRQQQKKKIAGPLAGPTLARVCARVAVKSQKKLDSDSTRRRGRGPRAGIALVGPRTSPRVVGSSLLLWPVCMWLANVCGPPPFCALKP